MCCLSIDTPDEAARDTVHRVIYDELCVGRVERASCRACVEVIARPAGRGAEGVILDRTTLHAAATWLHAEPSTGEPS